MMKTNYNEEESWASKHISIIVCPVDNVTGLNMDCRRFRRAILFTVISCTYLDTVISAKGWYVGRVPPSKFEYEKLNGFYTHSFAKKTCENDLQCGGFTFKGAIESRGRKEVYFFRFVPNDQASLDHYLKYPHWSTHIVQSRDYVIVFGRYPDAVSQTAGIDVRVRYM